MVGSGEYDYLFKLLLIGSENVGKSMLMTRFVDNEFSETYITTVGVDFKLCTISVGDSRCKLQIWDTAGQARFRTITSSYYRGVHGIFIVFDVTNLESFESLNQWKNEVAKFSSCNHVLLVANKCDLENERVVTSEVAMGRAKALGFPLVETSAKSGQNTTEMFAQTAQFLVAERAPPHPLQVEASRTDSGEFLVVCTNIGGERLDVFSELTPESPFSDLLELIKARIEPPAGHRWQVVLPNADCPDESQHARPLSDVFGV
eukprot:TRINITY_DN6115_c0_g1_i4.p1 TRINITY_DN6115_c0_g1~~TRINITY_DN6115_c0_g1_i4.p1  ORF type:complete len:261 (-),score=30.31 TRINITY_DN6115_c0_g1_i4:184-966(-)